MEEIEEGAFFKLNTDNRQQAYKIVVKSIWRLGELDKGIAVKKIREKEAFVQKTDCKKFVKNLIRARNIEIESAGRRKITLPNHRGVTAK